MPSSWWKRPRIQGVSVKGKKGKGKFDAMDVVIKDKARAGRSSTTNGRPNSCRCSRQIWVANTSCVAANCRCCSRDRGCAAPPASPCIAPCRAYRIASIAEAMTSQRSTRERSRVSGDAKAIIAGRSWRRSPMPPQEPMALIAAEHTAQLNAPQNEDVFSKAEENELALSGCRTRIRPRGPPGHRH